MQCCGQERTTKFCPDCGGVVTAPPLSTLLRHVKVHTAQQQNRVLRAENAAEDSYDRNRLPSQRKALAKWQTWADELEKAIAALERETNA